MNAGVLKPTRFPRLAVAALAAAVMGAGFAADAFAAKAKGPLSVPWPPKQGKGDLFAHFGEEHINDEDGGTLLPKVIEQVGRYNPNLVTTSGDKANDGTIEQLQMWLDAMMHFDAIGVPWYAGVGNHDRKAPPGAPGGTFPLQDFTNYRGFFADRPYPMGDGPPYPDPRFSPRAPLPGDEEGAATHYFVDYGSVRWIFIDNGCFSIILCSEEGQAFDSGQSDAPSEDQFTFLGRAASEARDQGRLAFVVMHMPTRDPADQSYRDTTAREHTMGKTVLGVADNTTFEEVAAESGVDGVFLGHIKAQFRYRGQGNIPYFIDGGAGGELYTEGPVGVDHGYWHGYRLLRVNGTRWYTENVPIFVKNGITIEGPTRLVRGQTEQYAAFGRQPVFNDPAKVDRFEIRDPDPIPAQTMSVRSAFGTGVWGLLGVALLGSFALAWRYRGPARGALMVGVVFLASGAGVGGVSIAQQGEPTTTQPENLPTPSRIWTSSDPLVLAPVKAVADDRRRDPQTQTDGGIFRGVCPGRATLEIASGFESRQRTIRVASRPGKIARSIRFTGRSAARGSNRVLARVNLAQPARVIAEVRTLAGRRVAKPVSTCTGRTTRVRWNGRRGLQGRGQAVAPGSYRLVVRVLSDRKTFRRARTISLG